MKLLPEFMHLSREIPNAAVRFLGSAKGIAGLDGDSDG
jgi:hypothetical protein